MDMFQNTVGDQVIRHASASFGESAEHISTALEMVLPALLARIIQKGQSNDGVRDLSQYLQQHGLDGNALAQIHTTLQDTERTEELMNSGTTHLRFLLGDSNSAVVDAVAGANGLKTSSAAALLKLTAPLVLHVTGRYIREKSLDVAGIKQFIQHQASDIHHRLPANLAFLATPVTPVAPEPPSAKHVEASSVPEPPTGASKYLPWIVLLLASLGLFYLVEKGCGRSAPETKPDSELQENQSTTPDTRDTISSDTI